MRNVVICLIGLALVGSAHARTYYSDGAVHNLSTMTSESLGINNGTTINIGNGVVVTLYREATYSTSYIGVGDGEAFLNLSGNGQLLFAQEMAITTSDSEPAGTITMTGTSYMNPATYYGGMRGNGTFNISDNATLEIRADGELYTPGFYVGDMNYGPELTATFNQWGNSTVMSLGSDLKIGAASTGIYNMSGGTLILGGTIVIGGADDSFNFSGGEIILDGNKVGFNAANSRFIVTGVNAANYIEVFNSDGTTSLTFINTIEVTPSAGNNGVSEQGPSTDSFEVVLLEAPNADVTVTVAPEDPNGDFFLNAEAPNDAVTLTFTTSNWDTPQTVTITAVDDDESEPTEIRYITVTGDSTDSLFQVALQTYVTIYDNDSASIITGESDGSTYVVEGGATDSYTVALGFLPTSDVTIAIYDVAGEPNQVTLDGGESTTLTFTTSNWDTAQTVTVEAIDDGLPETDPHNTALTHSVSQPDGDHAYHGISVLDVDVSVGENDCGAGPFKNSDLNEDCITNLMDFAILASDYLFCSIAVCD